MNLGFLLAAFLLPNSALANDDWPGWRGDASGVGSGSPPTTWSEPENVRWKAPIPGKGSSSPVIWKDRVYVTTAVAVAQPQEEEKKEEPAPTSGEGAGREGGGWTFRAQDPGQDPPGRRGRGQGRGGRRGGRGMRSVAPVEHDFHVFALNRADGSILGNTKVANGTPHAGTHSDGNFATPTLVTDGETLIASFGSTGVFALDATGEVLWSKDLGDSSSRSTPRRARRSGARSVRAARAGRPRSSSRPKPARRRSSAHARRPRTTSRRARCCGAAARTSTVSAAARSPVPCTRTDWCSSSPAAAGARSAPCASQPQRGKRGSPGPTPATRHRSPPPSSTTDSST